MTRIVCVAVLALAASGCSVTRESNDVPPDDHWTRWCVVVPFAKVSRGVQNIVVSPLDIPATMARVNNEENNFGYAFFAGLTEGVGNTIVRALAGVTEILTFPIVSDSDPMYQKPLGQRATPKTPEVVP